METLIDSKTDAGKAPRVNLQDALKRIRKAQRTNSELAANLRDSGASKAASEYAEGSAFAFWQAEQILTGKL